MLEFVQGEMTSQLLIAAFVLSFVMLVLIVVVMRIDRTRRKENYVKSIKAKTEGAASRASTAIRAAEISFSKSSLRGEKKLTDLVLWAAMRRDLLKAGLPGFPILLPLVSIISSYAVAFFLIAAPIVSIWIQAAAIFPLMYLMVRVSILGMFYEKRRVMMLTQLVNFIEHVQRAVGVGASPDVAVSEAIREADSPLRENLLVISELLDLGYDFVEAIRLAADRVDLPEFDIFAASLGAQATTGGSIGEVLKEVIDIARARVDLQKKVSTMTGEGRFNALLLGSLPIGLMVHLRTSQPEYFDALWRGEGILGPAIFFGTLIAAVFGAWLAMRIAQIKV
jgi:tight adherence protein B